MICCSGDTLQHHPQYLPDNNYLLQIIGFTLVVDLRSWDWYPMAPLSKMNNSLGI
jgi:hypothetical protein